MLKEYKMAEEKDLNDILNSWEWSWVQGQHKQFAEYSMADDEAVNVLLDTCEYDEVEELLQESFSITLYDALSFLLTGISLYNLCYSNVSPAQNWALHEAIFGAEYPDYNDNANEFMISLTKNTALPEIIKALENIDIKELEKNFDPKIYIKEKIYPYYIWDTYTKEELFKVIINEYNGLLDFYRKAKDKNAHVIILVYGHAPSYEDDDEEAESQMDEFTLNNLLKKIGMKFFVDYYSLLASNNTVNEIIEIILKNHKDYSTKSLRTRIYNSRKIINEGAGKQALLQIQNADKIDANTKDKIKELL
jgi:hypothetical protein